MDNSAVLPSIGIADAGRVTTQRRLNDSHLEMLSIRVCTS